VRDVIIMAAPNGARKTKSDHPALPVSITDTVSEAAACYAAGASALHAHVRGSEHQHLLDAGLYRELLDEMARRLPDMLVQVTSEAVGIYTPQQQVACIEAVRPRMASMVLREISSDFTRPDYARQFFEWCVENEVHVQHIVFSEEELRHFLEYREAGVIPASQRCLMLVLGRYRADFQSEVADLDPFLQHDLTGFDWFVCAFGHQEQQCALAAIEAGGHARVGFENNLHLPDGEIAGSNSALVASLVEALRESDYRAATSASAAQLLGVRSA
jgi:uncharacterized protein (DUF849 family)